MNIEPTKSSTEDRKFIECKEYKDKAKYRELYRDFCIILSCKALSKDESKKLIQYHVIVEIPNYSNAYTVYHSKSPIKSKMFFDYFAPILNPILKCKINVQSLVEILKKITKYPKFIIENHWTLCHVYAKFNIYEVFDLIKQNKQTNNELINRLTQTIFTNVNNQTKVRRFTALHMAVRRKHFKFAEKFVQLLHDTIDFRVCDWKGNNAFHYAILIENKNKEFLKMLLNYCNKEQLVDALKAKNCRQCTALHLACYSHKLDCIKLLLKIPLPIECFVITSDYIKPEQNLIDYHPSKEIKLTDLGYIESSSNPAANESSASTDENAKGDDEEKTKSDSILFSESKSGQQQKAAASSSSKLPGLIQFTKQQINSFVEEEEEIFKGGTPLHWCNDKRHIGELLQIGFIRHINVRNINQETALHVAVKRNNFRLIVVLFCTGEVIDQTGDCIGNTPLHIAVSMGNLNLVKLLTLFGDESILNSKNNLGIVPRHLAAQNLSKAHAQILNALHLVGAKRCDMNETSSLNQKAPNLDGRNVERTIQCNKGCSKTGDYNGIEIYKHTDHEEESWYTNFILKRITRSTRNKMEKAKKDANGKPVDLTGKSSLTKMNHVLKNCLSLIKFGSKEHNANKMDKNKLRSVGSLEQRDEKNSMEDSNETSAKNDKEQAKLKVKGKANRMLCLDGGGVKGLFALQLLIELEKRLKHPLTNYFNWFVGTSTGSFIATLLSLNYKLTDIRTLYFVIKDKVFQNNLPYDDEILENYLKKYLGERTMGSILNCKLTITSTLYDRLPVQLHLFRNYPSPNELLNKPMPKARLDNKDKTYKYVPNYKEQVLWKACRASSAAPVYFNSFGSFCDGGLISNSPVIDMIAEHFVYNELYEELNDQKNQNQELEFVLSLGCGTTGIRLNDYEYDFSSFSRVDRLLKFAINAKPFSMILISELNNTEHHKQLRTMAWCKSMGIPYIRLSPFLGEKVSLDERRDEIIVDGLWKCKAYFCLKKELIDDLVNLLESSCEKPKDEEQPNVPKFDLNYKIDFDDSKMILKNLKRHFETFDDLVDEDKKSGPLPYDP